MKYYFLATVIFVLFYLDIAFAENPYVRNGSIGQQSHVDLVPHTKELQFRPLEKLVGEKVIFLPKNKSSQSFGYQMIDGGQGKYGNPTYEECVGRIGKITEISDNFSGKLTIQMEDNGQIYTGKGSESVDGIAMLADIEYARSKYIGKTLWYKIRWLATYDDKKGVIDNIELKKYSPVQVIDVVAGWYSDSPVRFILRTPKGEEGYEDVNLTGTNVSHILRDKSNFDELFLLDDPKKKFKWSPKVWAAIEKEKVFVGMNPDQAKMSWGKPKEINRTTTGKNKNEQWVYSSGIYLYFDNGKLSAIQN